MVPLSINLHFINYLNLLILSLLVFKSDADGCDSALQKCSNNTQCASSLHEYRTRCRSELNGKNINCSQTCITSIEALAKLNHGDNYLNCACLPDNTVCNIIKQRIDACYQLAKQQLVNTNELQSCHDHEAVCNMDQVCAKVWNNYRYFCNQTLQQFDLCTTRCIKSIQLLKGYGFSVTDCHCNDNNNSGKCNQEKMNVQKLCYGMQQTLDTSSGNYISGDELMTVSDVPTNAYNFFRFESFILILSLIMAFI